MRISIHASRELQVLHARLRELPTEVRKQIRVWTKADALPMWREGIAANVHSRIDGLLFLRTARVAVSDRGVRLQAARVGKALRGGLNVKTQWHAYEFGGHPGTVRTVERTSKNGTRFTVKRHTQRQLPLRVPTGRVAYPAVASTVPRIASLWVQTVQRAGAEAHEGIS